MVTLPVEQARAGQLKPGLEVFDNGLVEQHALGVAGIVEFGLACCRSFRALWCAGWCEWCLTQGRAVSMCSVLCVSLSAT